MNNDKGLSQDQKKQWAYALFMSGETNQNICLTVKISDNTLRDWRTEEKWDAIRTSKLLTREDLVNRLLQAAALLIENAIADGKFDGLGDQLAKISTTIEKLEKKGLTAVERIQCFMDYNKWCLARAKDDPAMMDTIKQNNGWQNTYIREII